MSRYVAENNKNRDSLRKTAKNVICCGKRQKLYCNDRDKKCPLQIYIAIMAIDNQDSCSKTGSITCSHCTVKLRCQHLVVLANNHENIAVVLTSRK